MAKAYDLVVIGGGSGGVRAARMASSYGASVAIVEEYRYGGTCVIRGCVPKKLFVYASRFADEFEIAGSFGWTVDASFDWPTLLKNKDREIDRLENAYVSMLDKANAEIYRDRAVLTGPNTVHLINSGEELEAKHILIATGSRPFVPEIEGVELGITSEEAFHLKELPKSILIEGGGYIALEFATIYAGLGVDTTVIYRRDRILRGFDEDIRLGVEEGMEARGIKFIYDATVQKLEQAKDGVKATLSNSNCTNYGAVMFATGRVPNTSQLGLEHTNVELDATGGIVVDAYSQSAEPSIYAVGDVTNRAMLTPVAIREGWYFAETVFNSNKLAVDHSVIASGVFTEPEVGTIGLSEEQAAELHGDIDVYVSRFRPMQNTLSDKPGRMLLKLITKSGEGQVLGCHVLGPGAAEMVQLVAIPMGMGATKKDFDRAMAVHPTASEELVTFKAPSYSYKKGKKAG